MILFLAAIYLYSEKKRICDKASKKSIYNVRGKLLRRRKTAKKNKIQKRTDLSHINIFNIIFNI